MYRSLSACAVAALSIALGAPSGAKTATGTPLAIGAILSISGPFAPLGEPERNALKIAEREINAAGGVRGRPISIEIVDDEGKPDTAAQLATQLTGRGVAAIIGGTLTATTNAINRVTQQTKTLQIFMTPTAQLWETKSGIVHNLFEATPRNELETKALITFGREKLGMKKMAILYQDDQYGQVGGGLVQAEAQAQKVDVAANESYPRLGTDFTAQLLKIKNSGADSIVLWCSSTSCPLIVRQIRQLGLKTNIIGSTGILSDNFLRVAGPDGTCVFSDSDINFTHPNGVQRRFLKLYRDAYNARPANFASFAWDAAHLIVIALNSTGGKPDLDGLATALETMKPYTGTTATFKYTPTNHNGVAERDVHIAYDRNGVWFTEPKADEIRRCR